MEWDTCSGPGTHPSGVGPGITHPEPHLRENAGCSNPRCVTAEGWTPDRMLKPMNRSLGLLCLVALALPACAITSRDATTELPGTSWELVEIDGAAPTADPPPTLTFEDDGTVTGSGGCNAFSGSATIDGTSLSIGPLASTQMACPDPVGQEEQAFLLAMDEVTGYTIDEEGRLVLEGGTALVFEVAAEGG